MIGNAGEWQQDCLIRTLEGAPADGGVRTNDSCLERPMRGGSWFSGPRALRSAFRVRLPPGVRGNKLGFRLAQDR